jgi:hypothetical protein
MEQISIKRIIEPFVYFPNHASAIPGLGGAHRSPDPNYCFHTHYFSYLPGTVLVHITFRKARATTGELSIRIHGYRPDNQQLGIKLIAADRMQTEALKGEDHTVVVRFASIPGVHYAVYGYFSAPSDLLADGIDLIAEEQGGDDLENYQEAHAPPTMLNTAELTGVNALVSTAAPDLLFPNSQPCTSQQLQSAEYHEAWPALDMEPDLVERWRGIFALQALHVYGFLQRGARALLIGPIPPEFIAILREHGCAIHRVDETGTTAQAEGELLPSHLGHFDIVLCLQGSQMAGKWESSAQFLDHATRRLMTGGMAAIIVDYIHAVPPEGHAAPQAHKRADMERLALRLISHGYRVAQFKFPSAVDHISELRSVVPFGVLIQR